MGVLHRGADIELAAITTPSAFVVSDTGFG